MKTYKIASQKDLDRFKDTYGYKIDGNAEFSYTANAFEGRLYVRGCLSVEAGHSIWSSDSIKAGGSIKVGDSIEAQYGIEAGDSIEAGGSIDSGDGIKAGGWIKAGDLIRAVGWINAGGWIEPSLPDKPEITNPPEITFDGATYVLKEQSND